MLTAKTFLAHSADHGWGYSTCCHTIFHYGCLSEQSKPRQTEYVTRDGMADVPTDCPSCRGELSGSKRRMLCPGPQGDEPPRRQESLRQKRARLGFVSS